MARFVMEGHALYQPSKSGPAHTASSSTSAADLERLAAHKDPGVRAAVGNNASCPPALLLRLAEDSSARVRQGVAGNRMLPIEVADRLASDKTASVRANIAANTGVSPATLLALFGDRDFRVAAHAAANPSLALGEVEEALDRDRRLTCLLCHVARNPKVTDDDLVRFFAGRQFPVHVIEFQWLGSVMATRPTLSHSLQRCMGETFDSTVLFTSGFWKRDDLVEEVLIAAAREAEAEISSDEELLRALLASPSATHHVVQTVLGRLEKVWDLRELAPLRSELDTCTVCHDGAPCHQPVSAAFRKRFSKR